MALGVRVAALFKEKLRKMVQGHRATWQMLRALSGKDTYVWFHAASLGEFEQGRPLMERLRREHPEKKIRTAINKLSNYRTIFLFSLVYRQFPYWILLNYQQFPYWFWSNFQQHPDDLNE